MGLVAKRPQWTVEDMATLRDLVKSGHSLADAAKLLGRSQAAVAAQAFRLGLELRTL